MSLKDAAIEKRVNLSTSSVPKFFNESASAPLEAGIPSGGDAPELEGCEDALLTKEENLSTSSIVM